MQVLLGGVVGLLETEAGVPLGGAEPPPTGCLSAGEPFTAVGADEEARGQIQNIA